MFMNRATRVFILEMSFRGIKKKLFPVFILIIPRAPITTRIVANLTILPFF